MGFRPNFDALGSGVGAAPCGPFENAAALQFRGNTKDRKNDLGKIRSGIEEGFGQ
jgi:hypothetical protein